MSFVFIACFVMATALAWILSAKRSEHRPVAVLLSMGLVSELVDRAMDVTVLAPLRAQLGVSQWSGWAYAAAVADNAIMLVWPAALLGAAIRVFADRKPWPAACAWAGTTALFAVAHPFAGNGSQIQALLAARVFALVTVMGLLISWYRRRKPTNSAHTTMTMIVLTEVLSLFGAWRMGPESTWLIAQALYLTMLGIVILVQGRFLWDSPQSPQPSA